MNSEVNIFTELPTQPQSEREHPLSSAATMRQSSPLNGVVLPPPLPHSQSQSPRQSLTLPPLSMLSPMNNSSSKINNLIHPEKRVESSMTNSMSNDSPYRRDSQLSPRAKARRQSMEAPRAGFPFETIEEHSILHDHDGYPYQGQGQGQSHGQRRPRRSMPNSAAERPYA